jgi:hypothetical protein
MEPSAEQIDLAINNQPIVNVLNSSFDSIEDISWDNLDYDVTGVPTGYLGKEWDKFRCVDIRTAVSKLRVKGHKNLKKGDMISLIISTSQNLVAYSLLEIKNGGDYNSKTPRKEVQCPYRLMNILFSDQFSTEFATIGKEELEKDISKLTKRKNDLGNSLDM